MKFFLYFVCNEDRQEYSANILRRGRRNYSLRRIFRLLEATLNYFPLLGAQVPPPCDYPTPYRVLRNLQTGRRYYSIRGNRSFKL